MRKVSINHSIWREIMNFFKITLCSLSLLTLSLTTTAHSSSNVEGKVISVKVGTKDQGYIINDQFISNCSEGTRGALVSMAMYKAEQEKSDLSIEFTSTGKSEGCIQEISKKIEGTPSSYDIGTKNEGYKVSGQYVAICDKENHARTVEVLNESMDEESKLIFYVRSDGSKSDSCIQNINKKIVGAVSKRNIGNKDEGYQIGNDSASNCSEGPHSDRINAILEYSVQQNSNVIATVRAVGKSESCIVSISEGSDYSIESEDTPGSHLE
jgi:hypothetical protein